MKNKIVLKYTPDKIKAAEEYNETSDRKMIAPAKNLDELETMWNDYNSQYKKLKREADWRSLEIFGINNQDHYEYMKSKFLKKAKVEVPEPTDVIEPSDTEVKTESTKSVEDILANKDKIESRYTPEVLQAAEEYNNTSGRFMVVPPKDQSFMSDDANLAALEEIWKKYNSQYKKLKREADWRSLVLFGINNIDHYEYLKTKYLYCNKIEMPEPTDILVPSENEIRTNLFEFSNIRSKDVEDLNESNDSINLEMSSFDYGCLLLENTSGIKRDLAKLSLSLYETKSLPETLRKEKLLSVEDPEENGDGFIDNKIKVDYPALPPDELLDLGVFGNDNYYAEYKAIRIDENHSSKDWFDTYQKYCVGIETEETEVILKSRHNKLIELCNELSNDTNNAQLKQYILELGWNPELPYTPGNRALVSKYTRNKLNKYYNEFSFIDIQGIEDVDYIDEAVSDEDSKLYPVYIVLLSSTTAFGKVIKKATKSIWTHGAIAFDTALDKIYSYDREGFTYDSLTKYGKDSKISVYTMFLNKKDYIKLKSRLDYFIANKKKTRYGYDNLLRVLTGKVKNNDLNLICTEFVDKMFKYIGIDLTHKSSNLVTPEDMSKSVKRNKKIYMVYNGFTGNYKKNKTDKRVAKLQVSANALREIFTDQLCNAIIEKYAITPIVEVKEFPVQFDKEGNLLIKNIKKINYNEEYNKSHKLLKEYEKTGNIEGMKYELSKLWFMYTVLEKIKHEKKLTREELKAINDSRARIYNDFQKYLNIVQTKEKDFNFNNYYEESPFSNSAYKLNASTIKYAKDFIKSLII